MLLLATLAATASAHITDGLDAQSLIQMEVGRHRPAPSSSNATRRDAACTCMSWKSVYLDHNVSCGQGQELTWSGSSRLWSSVYDEGDICDNFYTQVTDNFCTQHMFGTLSTDQWCYVSSACQHLNGGLPVSDSVSWKMCQDGFDRTLRSMQPEQLELMSQHENRDAGLMMKMAYPISNQGLFWPDVKAFITGDTPPDDDGPNSAMTDPIRRFVTTNLVNTTLRSTQASGYPMIFDSHDGQPPFGVVYGQKVVESNWNTAWFNDHPFIPGLSDDSESMGNENQYECIAGCTN
jgi:hypothetical protein